MMIHTTLSFSNKLWIWCLVPILLALVIILWWRRSSRQPHAQRAIIIIICYYRTITGLALIIFTWCITIIQRPRPPGVTHLFRLVALYQLNHFSYPHSRRMKDNSSCATTITWGEYCWSPSSSCRGRRDAQQYTIQKPGPITTVDRQMNTFFISLEPLQDWCVELVSEGADAAAAASTTTNTTAYCEYIQKSTLPPPPRM